MTDILENVEEDDVSPIGTDEEFELANSHQAEVYNNIFVHYDNSGKVHLISNIRSQEFNNFEIDFNLITSFVEGIKFYGDYDIEHFYNISKGLIVDNLEIEKTIKSETLLYTIEHNDISSNEITIEHNSQSQKWKFTARSGLDEKLIILSSTEFFICKKDDPHYLYSSYRFEPRLLIQGPVEIDFKTDLEMNLENVSVVTVKKFNSYGLKAV